MMVARQRKQMVLTAVLTSVLLSPPPTHPKNIMSLVINPSFNHCNHRCD